MTAKADRVKHLLDNEDLREAFANVREYYRDLIEETPVSDDTALLDIRKMLQLLRQVEHDLLSAVEHGTLEDFRAAEQERPTVLGDIKKWKNDSKRRPIR
jgi:hypothetical protein